MAADYTPILAQVLAKLPKVRSKWPAEAKLKWDVKFNLMDGETVVGVISLNAGTRVKIATITPRHAVIRIGSTESPLPVTQTDLIELMGGLEKILALPDDPAPATSKP